MPIGRRASGPPRPVSKARISVGLTLAAAFFLSLFLLSPIGPRRLGAVDLFRWVWLAWAAAFCRTASLLGGRSRRAAIGAAALAAALFVFEVYLSGGLRGTGLPSAAMGREYTAQHAVQIGGALGYAPVKNTKIESKKIAGGRVVYDVVYSIDENGFRPTPALPAGTPAVLFLGDSFTFGEGVRDDETFPAVFQAASGLKAIDLAYRGYGPNQMLRLLETGGELAETARYRPVGAVYLFIPGHVERTAGDTFGVSNGPRYELDAQGTPRWRGLWHSSSGLRAMQLLQQSAVVRWCWRRWPRSRTWRARDVDRLVAVVAALQRAFKERYHGDFHVLLWDKGYESGTRGIMERLRGRGVDCVLLTKAVPEFERPELFLPHDGHPGAALDRALGRYLARRVRAPARGWTSAGR